VWVTEEEVTAIAEKLGMRREKVMELYVRRVWRRYSLKEKANGDCVMLEGGRCAVYDVRPTQCVTFPFWRENLRTRNDWEELSQHCPGINRGPLIGWEEIEDALEKGI
jgi:Fe-S-cluster containining protein